MTKTILNNFILNSGKWILKSVIHGLVLLLFFISSGTAQNISGLVTDVLTKEVIQDCNIKIQGSVAGTTSNNKGQFKINAEKFPVTLFISHIGYQQKYIKLNNSVDNLVIELERKSYLIDSVNVSSDPVINIVKDKPLYIWDYDFFEGNILILAFMDNSMFKPRLILLNEMGDTLCVKPVKKARKLYKDCLDNVHLICTDEVHQIYYDSKELHLLYSYPLELIETVLNPCVEYMTGNYYISKYFYDDQLLQYYSVDHLTKDYKILTTITDSLGIVHLIDEERFANMGDYNEFDRRFAKLFFFNPVFAPLVKVDSLICIFNYSNNVIEKYNSEGTCTEVINIGYHKRSNWKEYLLIDEVLGKAYTVFINNGILSVHEINLKTGVIDEGITLSGYVFVEKFMINNGYLYFLYKENSNIEYKKLFRMKI